MLVGAFLVWSVLEGMLKVRPGTVFACARLCPRSAGRASPENEDQRKELTPPSSRALCCYEGSLNLCRGWDTPLSALSL